MNGQAKITTGQIVVFTLDELLFAFPLHAVVRVIHAVEIRPLPEAPEVISGIINVQGMLIPVADIRKRLGLTEKEINPDDRIIIADTGTRKVAIPVDTVTGMRDVMSGQHEPAGKSFPFARHLKGVTKTDGEIILIYDLEQFLSLKEEKKLEKALKNKSK